MLRLLTIAAIMMAIANTAFVIRSSMKIENDISLIEENQELKNQYRALKLEAEQKIEEIVKQANKQIGIANNVNKAYDSELKKCLSKTKEI